MVGKGISRGICCAIDIWKPITNTWGLWSKQSIITSWDIWDVNDLYRWTIWVR